MKNMAENKKKIDPQTTNVMDQGTSFPAQICVTIMKGDRRRDIDVG